MARTTFARTVVQTICEVTYIDENNDKQNTTVTLYGDYDIAKAQKPALKKLGAKGGVVTSVKHKSFYGTMNIEKFAENCDKKNFKEW
jgi:hypothetical protein